MSAELLYALDQLEKEKGIDKEIIIDALEQALISAYKKNFGSTQSVEVSIDRRTGDIRVYALKTIVDVIADLATEMSLEQAQRFGPDFEIGDIVEVEVTPKKFGRIAAQTAKQVVMQRIREAERGLIFDEFANREEDIVNGVVSRFDRKNIIIDLGKTEAVLPPSEQTPGEKYNVHDRIKIYVISVKKTNKSPQIYVSRTHPGLVKRLLELEVPEVADGTVEIKTIAREAGSRTKIAISSRNENVDPVGACVGQRGSRIRAIVDELHGEMIDVIKWSSNDEEYVAASLSPAKVLQVGLDDESKVARVVVPDFQLSLAIGKEGQNARLAAKLTGWKIDIKSESQLRDHIESQLFNINSSSYDNDEYEENETLDVADEPESDQDSGVADEPDVSGEEESNQDSGVADEPDVSGEEESNQDSGVADESDVSGEEESNQDSGVADESDVSGEEESNQDSDIIEESDISVEEDLEQETEEDIELEKKE